jgi:hypothetical protein
MAGGIDVSAVDVSKPVQVNVQGSQLDSVTPGTLQRDSFADDVIPVVEPTAAQETQLSIPIKRDSSTLLPFTTLTRCRIDTLNAMGREMKDRIVGPMAVANFLDEFLPNPKDYDSSDFASRFATASNAGAFDLQSVGTECELYKPFVSDACTYIEIVNSPPD